MKPLPYRSERTRPALVQLLMILVAALSFPATYARAATDVVLRGVLHDTDNQTYVQMPFDVPAGATKLAVELTYQGRDQGTIVLLDVHDPERLRGSGSGGKLKVVIAEAFATPSFLQGPIQPGRWRLGLWVANIRKGVTSPFEARIRITGEADVDAITEGTVRSGPGWYRGDLHTHTGHSDATCANPAGHPAPCPLFLTLEAARAHGLDFIAITDHNATSQYEEMAALAPYFDNLLLIPGREITTREGHFNLIGATRFVDFGLGAPGVAGGRDMNAVLRDSAATHGLVSINHPGIPTGEDCLGCGWSAPNTNFDLVDSVEIANGGIAADFGGFPEGPLSGIRFWEAQLDQGRRITGVGGSDNHDAVDGSSKSPVGRQSPVGTPATVVFAENLSQEAILKGIRAGRVFIDLQNIPGRLLDVSATSGTAKAVMGGALALPCGGAIEVDAHVVGLTGGRVELVIDGRSDGMNRDIQRADETIRLEVPDHRYRHWFRVDVRSPSGARAIIGNPIYTTGLDGRDTRTTCPVRSAP
ncbi:MAG: CehA/McbA family metallohydrolase [Caulobacteraceae bacterium]|nr:CehA/McbA family metallohydrolase [Caulobacteraceae bacterium]